MSVSKLSQRLKRLEERSIVMTEPMEIRVSYIDPKTIEETDFHIVTVGAFPDKLAAKLAQKINQW